MAQVLTKICTRVGALGDTVVGIFGRNPIGDRVFLAQYGVVISCLTGSKTAQPRLVLNQKPLCLSFSEMALRLYGRSPSRLSYGYASADDPPTCFASFTLIPESFMQYVG